MFPLALTNLPCERRGLILGPQGYESRSDKRQICGRRLWVVRTTCNVALVGPGISVETLWRSLIFLPQQKPV